MQNNNKFEIKKIDWRTNPRLEHLIETLKQDGIFVLTNYFTPAQISILQQEFDNIYYLHEDKVEILEKEDVSRDKRIFGVQNFSNIFRDYYHDNSVFNTISQVYTNRVGERKTLINLLEFSEDEVRNSGAGWHRDNHDCQFKIITYLTDVNENNGNFQWICNSSKKHIGYPTPRTESYNTRFFDETIEKEVLSNPFCQTINVVGKAGDTIIVDTTYIHRGNIIKEGHRKAVTQYFF